MILTSFCVGRLVGGTWGIASQHLLILGHRDPLALDNMHVFQSTQHIMVYRKLDLGVELGAFFDRERFVFERLEGVGARQVERDVWAAGGFNGEGLDDAFARVVGVADGVAGVEAQGGFPAVEGFVVLVCFVAFWLDGDGSGMDRKKERENT